MSYVKAANLLERMKGSVLSATAVMLALRAAGALCAAQDESLANSLYRDGVLPGGAEEAEELCLEADGTWFNLSKVKRVHVGADGEGRCLSAGQWLPKAEASVHFVLCEPHCPAMLPLINLSRHAVTFVLR